MNEIEFRRNERIKKSTQLFIGSSWWCCPMGQANIFNVFDLRNNRFKLLYKYYIGTQRDQRNKTRMKKKSTKYSRLEIVLFFFLPACKYMMIKYHHNSFGACTRFFPLARCMCASLASFISLHNHFTYSNYYYCYCWVCVCVCAFSHANKMHVCSFQNSTSI